MFHEKHCFLFKYIDLIFYKFYEFIYLIKYLKLVVKYL